MSVLESIAFPLLDLHVDPALVGAGGLPRAPVRELERETAARGRLELEMLGSGRAGRLAACAHLVRDQRDRVGTMLQVPPVAGGEVASEDDLEDLADVDGDLGLVAKRAHYKSCKRGR